MSEIPIKIFIGSGEASLLERKTLIYSLNKHSKRKLDIYVFNGTHNTVEHNQEQPALTSLPLQLKYLNGVTEHTFYRYLVSEICGHQGKAIYLDSDIVCLTDIGELFDASMDGCDLLALPSISEDSQPCWLTSVQLINCNQCRFNLELILTEIDQNLYSPYDFLRLKPQFLKYHSYQIGTLDHRWNALDTYNHETKQIHYTNLETQPWKYRNHPFGSLWFQYFREAIEGGYISQDDISLNIRRSYVRNDILYGNYFYECLIGKLKTGIRSYFHNKKPII